MAAILELSPVGFKRIVAKGSWESLIHAGRALPWLTYGASMRWCATCIVTVLSRRRTWANLPMRTSWV